MNLLMHNVLCDISGWKDHYSWNGTKLLLLGSKGVVSPIGSTVSTLGVTVGEISLWSGEWLEGLEWGSRSPDLPAAVKRSVKVSRSTWHVAVTFVGAEVWIFAHMRRELRIDHCGRAWATVNAGGEGSCLESGWRSRYEVLGAFFFY